jgi:hypothetical protein
MIQIFESCYIPVWHTRSNSKNSLKLIINFDCPLNVEQFYPDAGEEIPRDPHPEKGTRARLTVYVDAKLENNLFTRKSITGILVMLNYIPIG